MSQTTLVEFRGAEGAALSGRLHLPAGAPRAFAIFAHCFTCTKNIRAAVSISHALAEQGIASLRFDFTGLGESDGEFGDTILSSNVGDLLAAAEWLRAHHAAPTILVGHSLGGAAVLAAAHGIDEVRAVVTVGAPAEPAHVRGLFADRASTNESEGEALVQLAGRPFRIKRQFLEDLEAQCSRERIGALRRALLVMHSPQDNLVGIDNARRIFEAARHPKSFVSLDGADHLLSRSADATYVGNVLAAWAARYVPDVEAAVRDEEPRTVEVRGGRAGLRQQIRLGPHTLVADEPERLGGTDAGPNPYDLLLASLGACTSMTLRMYANHKKWPLDEVRVTLAHQKVHAADCESCETQTGKLDDVERRIVLEGDLDAEQRARLIEIADRCPVHRTLHGEVRVRTRLVD